MIQRAAFAFILIVVVGGYQAWKDREVPRPPGILAPNEPRQVNYETPQNPIAYKSAVLDPLAEFSLDARVLGKERYYLDKMASLVPTDLALGWGIMSDSATLKPLNLWQEARFYFYSWKGTSVVSADHMAVSSANMHLIPSTEYIDDQIRSVRKGQLVRLRGKLVRINFKDGSDAKSSLSRNDRGAGACEIVYVEAFEVF